jgi:prolyl 4-hydroxylase
VADVREQFARLREADSLLFATDERPADVAEAVSRYEALTREGNPAAMMRLGAHAAQGLGRPQNWAEALELLTLAAERAPPTSPPLRQLQLLAGDVAGVEATPARLRTAIDLETLLSPPPLERLADQSMVGVVRGFAPAGFSEWIMSRASTLERAQVDMMSTGERVESDARTAMRMLFGVTIRDHVICVMMERAARLFSVPMPNHEPPQVLSYEPGQRFAPHHDWIDPDLIASNPRFAARGQRVATLVTYLNTEFEDGETRFPILKLSFRGQPGDAIVFSNVTPDGAPDWYTAHEGAPVKTGRKWVLSQWLREKPQPL